MTRIHLIRHGETEWNLEGRMQGHKNSPLTSKGREQAQGAAKALQEISFDLAYSSSSGRAMETAQIIVNNCIPIIPRDDLREMNMGKWEGRLQKELQAESPEEFEIFWNSPDKHQPTEGESFFALRERAVSSFQKIVAETNVEELLLVSHAGYLKSLFAHIENRSLSETWDVPYIGNCSHSIIEISSEGNWKLTQYSGQQDW